MPPGAELTNKQTLAYEMLVCINTVFGPQNSITGLFCSLTPLYKLLLETLTVCEHLHNKEVPITQKWPRGNIIVSYL